MLAEVVITPDVFSGDDEVLRVRLRELRETLLPRRSTPIFVVCQLGADNWKAAVVKKIVGIRNRNLQSDAKALFDKILDSISVVRQVPSDLLPITENDWQIAAAKSTQRALLDAIVCTHNREDLPRCISVDEFVGDKFASSFSNPRFVARSTNAQDAALRTICQHADWMIIRLPQMRGSSDDEVVTVKQIIRLAAKREYGQANVSIEVHVCQQRDIPDRRLIGNIEDELHTGVKSLESLKLKLLPAKTFINRELLAGQWSAIQGGQRVKRARWLVTMAHVAIGGKSECALLDNSWSLFDRTAAHQRLQQIDQERECPVLA